jgi:hypothetical protein
VYFISPLIRMPIGLLMPLTSINSQSSLFSILPHILPPLLSSISASRIPFVHITCLPVPPPLPTGIRSSNSLGHILSAILRTCQYYTVLFLYHPQHNSVRRFLSLITWFRMLPSLDIRDDRLQIYNSNASNSSLFPPKVLHLRTI